MRIFINNKELELSDGTALELTDKNIVFSFDDIACQRTTNINIPATPKNMKIFGLSNDFHSDGTMCRQRHSAVIYEGLVAISGYLYINNYNHNSKTFNACFVGGELTNLIAIKDAGKISDILKSVSVSAPIWQSISDAHEANESTLTSISFTCVKRYANDPRPSSLVNIILSRLATRFNVTIPQLTGTMARLRIENPAVNRIPVYSARFIESAQDVLHQTIDVSATSQDGSQIFFADTTTYLTNVVGGQSAAYTLTCLKARTPVTITVSGLPTGASHSYAFIKGGASQQYAPTQGIVVNGYNNVINGGEYTFETGDIFTLVDNAFYESSSLHTGYNPSAFRFDIPITIESSRELQIGDAVRERDNLPEMTPIDLLKMCAALSGGTLMFDAETNAFSYSNLTASGTMNLSDVTKVSEQVRTIGSFAQNNTVSFNHDGVRSQYELSVNYPITNQNIDETNELLTMDVSEGEPMVGNSALVWVRSEDSPTIYTSNASNGSTYCSRITFARSTAMANLFANATEVTIETPLTLLQYHVLRPLVRIIWRNTEWIWREKQWKNGICKLKMVKSA